jgi:RNA polymerase sigma-70 factor (ECF subfamily)
MALTLSLTMTARPRLAESSSPDGALVSRARGGDDRAFEVLVRRHKDSVLNLARSIVSDDDAAQDVTQDTFIKAYQQLHRFRAEAAFSTWLYRIVVNEAKMHLRSRRRRQARWERQRDAHVAEAASAGRSAAGPEAITALMRELPEHQRVALALFYLKELSVEEIARTVGSPVGTVKARLSRGRERLRTLAKERGLV